MIVPEHNLASC